MPRPGILDASPVLRTTYKNFRNTLYGGDNADAMVPPGGIVARNKLCWLYDTNMVWLRGDASEAGLEAQLESVKKGLLFDYYKDTKLLVCPRDREGRRDGQQQKWFLERHLKVSSFVMNGAILGGKDGKQGLLNVRKMSAYRPDGIVFVEGNERLPGNGFRGAAYNPSHHISQRHEAKEFKRERGVDVGGRQCVREF